MMNTEEEYNVAARYRTVRKHLDNLGYTQAISLDALPLIEKLLADLIQTTESLKHFKSIAQENIEACSQLRSTVDPYKCDNARLIRDCNQLHLDLIEAKDTHQKQVKDLKKEIHKLECECNDLQLASSRNLQRIKELETESSRKSKKILELQGKCLKPTISNVGLAASKKRPCYPLRRPVLESEPLPKVGNKISPLPSLSNVDLKIVDLLSMADHKMNCLSHEVTKLKGELAVQTDNVHTLKSQITTKEKEIIRLKKMLEGGRPYTAVLKDCTCKKGEDNFALSADNVDHSELRVLQQAKLELEQQLKESLNKQHHAMSQALKLAERNEELEKELKDIDHIALAVEADCNSAVKENNRRVCRLQEKLEDVITQVHVLEGELTVERREVQELRADLEACKLEKRNIQRTLDSTLDEKKRMTDRINELTVIEKSLNDEIERMAKESENQRQDIIQLQYANRMLKEQTHVDKIVQGGDRDDLIQGKEMGEKKDQNKASKTHRNVTHASPILDNNQGEMEGTWKQREVTNDVNGVGYSDVIQQLREREIQLATLQHTIGQLRRERDYYRDEYNNIQDRRQTAADKGSVDLRMQIRELKRQLSDRENILDELQREKKELLRERSNLETHLQICKTEHRSFCRPCNVCKHSDPCNCFPSSAPTRDVGVTKGMFERLEHERNTARADVERLIEERDALRERLKMAAEAHTSEQRRLRENLAEIESRVKLVEKERQDLLLTQGTRRATMDGLEDQLTDMQEELRRTKQELATQRTQYFQLRALQDQTDQALGDVQNQLTHTESELSKAIDRNRAMERQQVQVDNHSKELTQEIDTLRSRMANLDHEKDQLLMVLDEKTERIAALEREIMSKEQHSIRMEQQVRELQHKNELCIDQSADQERQLRSMQLEIENLQRQLQSASSDRENAIQENRRLQDDLAAVTCEVRNLQRELEGSRAESHDLKRQLQTYVSEVRRAEELLNRKESERTEMLNHFRSLSMEATVLESNNHSLESEAAEARGALQSARDRMLDLERQLTDRDCLIRGYETKISELTQNVASMETQLRQQGEQRYRAEADLNAVRDLCVKLDQQKDLLMLQLDDKEALKSQYDAQISRLTAEQTMIQDHMNRDRAAVERLETLLDQARQESMNAQTNNQELQNEVSRLKQKISELQSKLSAESQELRQYQNQAAEYSKQISELRRQVTNERFDRARKEEESRRHSEGSSGTFLQQESTQDPGKTLHSSTHAHTDWNGAITNRYFQRERNEEYGVAVYNSEPKAVNQFNALHTGYLNESNNRRSLEEEPSINSNARVKQIKSDVRCINIILRSECGKHSKHRGYVENQVDHYENTMITRINEDLNQRNSAISSIETPRFESTKEKRNHDMSNVVSAKHQFTVSQPKETGFERIEINQENDRAVPSNRSNLCALRIQEPSAKASVHCVRSNNETSTAIKISDYETAGKLRYHKANEKLSNKPPSSIETTENIEENLRAFISVPLQSTHRSEKSEKIDRNVQFKHTKGETNCRAKISSGEICKDIHINKIMESGDKLFPTNVIVPEVSDTEIIRTNLEETNGSGKNGRIVQTMNLKTAFGGINVAGRNLTRTVSKDLKTDFEGTNARKKHSTSIILNPEVHSTLLNGVPKPTATYDSKLTNYKCMLPEFCTYSNFQRMHRNKNHLAMDKTINDSRLDHDLLSSGKNVTSKNDALKDKKLKGNRGDISYCTNTHYDVMDPSILNAEKSLFACKHTDVHVKHSSNCKTGKNLESQNDSYRNTLKNKKTTANKKVSVRSTSLSDSTLEVLERVLEGVEKLKNKHEITNNVNIPEGEEKVQSKIRDIDHVGMQNEITLKGFNNDPLIPSDFTRPEFLKMLIEIKDHTKNLEENLTIMNKSLKIKKKISEKLVPISERTLSGKISKSLKQQKDATTQQPDKRNTYIQEPNKEDIDYTELVHLPNRNNTNQIEVECHRNLQELPTRCTHVEQIGKKNPYTQESTRQMNFTESMLNEGTSNCIAKRINLNLQNRRPKQYIQNDTLIHINNSSGKSDGNIKEQSNDNLNYPFSVCVNTDESLKCCNVPAKAQISKSKASSTSHSGNGKTPAVSEFPSVSQHLRYFPSEKQNEQIDRYTDSILTFTPDDSDVRQPPLAARTLKENSSRKNEENCDVSCCYKSNSFFDTNTREDQVKKTISSKLAQNPTRQQADTINSTRVINYLDGKESSIFREERRIDDTEICFTRGISSTPLKSKYKRLEFRNFRPKGVIRSFILCDHKLMKCWPRKQRKSASPRVYKQLRSTTRKTEANCSVPLTLNADINSSNTIPSLFLQTSDDLVLPDFLVTACTQSSDFQITTATSVSFVTLKDNFNVATEEFNQGGMAKKGTCILS